MKKGLSILSVLSLAGTSLIGSTILNNIESIKTSNYSNKQDYKMKYIESPVPTKSFLTTAGDNISVRARWAYTTINLGTLKQEQIMGIGSRFSDSYTEHKVVSYEYHKIDNTAGIHHGPNFRDYFFADQISSSWDYYNAAANANPNFSSKVWWGLAQHWAEGTIKFLWHYNADSELLIDIVGTLHVGASLSAVEGVASIKLGSWFTIFYTE